MNLLELAQNLEPAGLHYMNNDEFFELPDEIQERIAKTCDKPCPYCQARARACTIPFSSDDLEEIQLWYQCSYCGHTWKSC